MSLFETVGLRVAITLGSVVTASCIASTLPSETGNPSQTAPIPTHMLGGKPQAGAQDAPEISRSTGKKGGFVILWPRTFPKDDPELHDIAGKLQKRLESMARAAYPDADIDLRPEPERVCPRSGCDGVSLGIVVTRKESGCAAAAVISKSGQSAGEIIPWIGTLKVTSAVPFREPPESYMKVSEYGVCGKVEDALMSNAPVGDDPKVADAVKSAKE